MDGEAEIVKPKHAGGRPLTYNPDIHPAMVLEYIETCVDRNTRRLQMEATGEFGGTKAWQLNIEVNIPTFEGCSLYLGVNKCTLFDWDKKYEEFSNSLDVLRNEQAKRLISGGLGGQYKSPIAKLLLGNHGYVDQSKNTVSGSIEVKQRPDLSNLSIEELETLSNLAKATKPNESTET